MRKPKTVRGFLKMMLEVADFNIYTLKGFDKLSNKEQHHIGGIIADVQNDLGDIDRMYSLLQKFKLKWKG